MKDYIFIILCNCGGELYQTGRFEKRYGGRRTFKCDRCEKTTTLSNEGIKKRVDIKNGK